MIELNVTEMNFNGELLFWKQLVMKFLQNIHPTEYDEFGLLFV